METVLTRATTRPDRRVRDDHAHERIALNVAELELEGSSVSHLLGKA